MKKPEIRAVRQADEANQVLTIVGGRGQYRRQPCGGCPWRIDQTGAFPAEAFRLSANTAYDQSMHEFGCHESGSENPSTCAGFLLNGSTHNIRTRMRLAAGAVRLDEVSSPVPLHDSYRAMAVANGVDSDDEALRPCR